MSQPWTVFDYGLTRNVKPALSLRLRRDKKRSLRSVFDFVATKSVATALRLTGSFSRSPKKTIDILSAVAAARRARSRRIEG